MFRVTIVIVCFFSVSSVAYCEGLFFQLPPDGHWASYTIDNTLISPDGTQHKYPAKVILRSVGREMVEEIPCRWIEIETSGEYMGISILSLNKLLIAEHSLQAGQEPLKEIYRWIRYQPENKFFSLIDDRKKLQDLFQDENRNEEHGLARIFRGPYEDLKRITTTQTIQSKLGERECKGILANVTEEKGDRTTHEKNVIRLHPDSPFGVVQWESVSKAQEDGQTVMSTHQVMLLSEYGTKAKSAIPEQE
ncbi:MAG: hypothetical protein P8M30_15330 [Planctomycetaceae bacterium]|jgi:hypothetical protein|nr:hypothetical protein [Planctomycetaceae bacterium]